MCSVCPPPPGRRGTMVAMSNLSQYPLKFSKALQSLLHRRCHPTRKRQRRHRSFLHSVSSPELCFCLFPERRSSAGSATRSPSVQPQRSLPRPGMRTAKGLGSPAPAAATLDALAHAISMVWRGRGPRAPGRQGARWLAPPTPSARLDRVRHIGCRSRRGQRFLLCLRCALQVPAA